MLSFAGHTPSRRSFLLSAAALGALVVTSCTSEPTGTATGPAATDPLEEVLKTHVALRDSYAHVLYAHVLATAPSLSSLIATLHKESVEHVKAIAAAMGRKPPAATSASSGSASAAAPTTGDPAAALAGVRTLESSTQKQTAALATTIAADRAPLLGSIAASHACHLVMLG